MAYTAEDTAAIKARIIDQIVQGDSLRTICTAEDMPAASTVFLWLRDDTAFSEQYARAKEAQVEALVDDILDIADDGSNDWMERKSADGQNVGWQENGEAMRRSQIRIDARKWLAGKLKPKKYGDKLDVEHSGQMDIVVNIGGSNGSQ